METMDLENRTAFIPDELEALFKYIPSYQLQALRQLSRECDEAAKRVLRKRRDIKLHLTTDNFDSRFNWKFLQFLNKSPENVFVAPVMNIQNENKSVQHLEQGKICISFQIMGEICERLGNRGIIKELIIKDGQNAPHFTSDFIFALLSHLPTLEALEVSALQLTLATSEQSPKFQLPNLKQIDFGYNHNCHVKEARNLLKTIIEASPKLEYISSISYNKTRQMKDMDVIPMLRDAKRLSKIKEILLTKSADLDILIQCKPKIELHSLKIETGDKDVVDSKKLFTFLQQQADNLKALKCDGESLVPKSILTLPVLPVLEELIFEQWRSGCLLSVNFGKQTPELKTLEIVCGNSSFHSWEGFLFYDVSSEMPPCLSLEEMQLYISGGEVLTDRTNQKMFDSWKILFPSVKKLSFGWPEQFDVEQFSKCWPKLETLSLWLDNDEKNEGRDLDELLFGINPEWKEKIDTTEEEWWMKVPAPEINATVANLESLKEFKVEFLDVGGFLTDFAVYFGLRHMQNLRKLEFKDLEEGVSTEAFNFLVKNLPKLEKLRLGEQKWEREGIAQ